VETETDTSNPRHSNTPMLSRQDILNLGEGRAFWELSFSVECMPKFVLVLVGMLAESLFSSVISVVPSVVLE